MCTRNKKKQFDKSADVSFWCSLTLKQKEEGGGAILITSQRNKIGLVILSSVEKNLREDSEIY